MGTLPVQPREVIAMNCQTMLVVLTGGQTMTRASQHYRGKGGKLRQERGKFELLSVWPVSLINNKQYGREVVSTLSDFYILQVLSY